MADGKNTPVCFFCLKYPSGHALKFKGVQEAEPPGRGLGAEGHEWGGGGGGGEWQALVALESISRLSNQIILIKLV